MTILKIHENNYNHLLTIVKRYEKALKDIVENADKFHSIELVEIAKEALNG